MKVKNCGDRPVPVGREVIPRGAVADVEEIYLYQPRITRLREKGILKFPYCEAEELAEQEGVEVEGNKVVLSVSTDVPSPEDVVEVEPVEPDDLTDLVHIGTGRAKRLNAEGVETFRQLVELGEGKLDSMLDITRDQADEIIEDAKERIG